MTALRELLRATETTEPPCRGSQAIISDDHEVRLGAAELYCTDCPLVAPCAAAGADQTGGVWGGVDRGARRPRSLGVITYWTPAEDHIAMCASTADAARALGRTPGAVMARRTRLRRKGAA